MAVPAAYLRYLREQAGSLPERYSPPRARGPAGEAVELENALAHPRLLVTGPPGSGKTTFLRYVAWLWCCGLEDTRTEWLPVPFLIAVPELPDTPAPGAWIDLLCRRNRVLGWGLEDRFVREKLLRGASVLLLDDFDGDSASGAIEAAASAFRAARFVVAASRAARLAGFETASLEAPDPRLIQSPFTCP